MINKWKETFEVKEKCRTCPLYPHCVRIKMCPEERENCTFIQCENKIELIKKTLLQRYNSFKQSKG
mgnify:FL=1